MTLKSFTFNPFLTNCYVCHDAGEAVLVDPSGARPEEHEAVVDYIDSRGLVVRHLLLTHAHIDHIFGCAYFAERYGQGFKMHRADVPLLEHGEEQARLFGIDLEAPPPPEAFLDEGDAVTFGERTWRVLHTPGHSPGSICFWDEAERAVLAGDVLFQGSIGRTDLWRGSMPELMHSIFQKLMPLGDDVRVFPGHGAPTTVGHERRRNPFLTGVAEA